MNTQNITLSIPKDVLRKAKILAVQRNSSLSALLTKTLTELVESDEAYQLARERQSNLLREPFDLGTFGKIDWKRDDLHER